MEAARGAAVAVAAPTPVAPRVHRDAEEAGRRLRRSPGAVAEHPLVPSASVHRAARLPLRPQTRPALGVPVRLSLGPARRCAAVPPCGGAGGGAPGLTAARWRCGGGGGSAPRSSAVLPGVSGPGCPRPAGSGASAQVAEPTVVITAVRLV